MSATSNKSEQKVSKKDDMAGQSIGELFQLARSGDKRAVEKLSLIKKVRVRAKIQANDNAVVGYYGVRRIREGQVFVIRTMADFSDRWMERVDSAGNPITIDGERVDILATDEIATSEPDAKGDGSGDEDVL